MSETENTATIKPTRQTFKWDVLSAKYPNGMSTTRPNMVGSKAKKTDCEVDKPLCWVKYKKIIEEKKSTLSKDNKK